MVIFIQGFAAKYKNTLAAFSTRGLR